VTVSAPGRTRTPVCRGGAALPALLFCLAFVPAAVAVTLAPGDLVVSDPNETFGGPGGYPPLGSGRIVKVDPTTGAQTLVSSGGLLDGLWGIAIEASGHIIVTDMAHPIYGGAPEIIRVDPATGAQTLVSAGGLLVRPRGLAIDAAGDILVADPSSGGTGAIIRVNPVTGAQSVVTSGGFVQYPAALTLDAAGDMYVAAAGTVGVSVVKVDPATGAQTLISPGGLRCWTGGIAVNAAGRIFVSEIYFYNGVFEIDPVTGAQGVLTAGYPFQDPWDVAVEPAGDLILADGNWFWPGRVIRVDPCTGAKTLVSQGGLLVDPAGIAVVRADSTPPVITCPGDLTVEQENSAGAVVNFDCTATDDQDPDPTVVCDPPSGSTFPLGATTVTCTATDNSGNTSQCTFTVTVVDTTPPQILAVSADPDTLWPPNHKMVDVTVTATLDDICDAAPTYRIVAVTGNEPVNGNAQPDWQITGDHTVRLRAERSGKGKGRVYTIAIEATDASGNTATAHVQVNVPHDQGKKKPGTHLR